MRVVYVAIDGKEFDTEAACLQHEKEDPLFKVYDQEGRLTEVGPDAFLLHIINDDKGGVAFQRLCEKRGEEASSIDFYSRAGSIDFYSRAGWYWWDGDEYSSVDEGMVRAIMRARYNIEITD